MRKSFWERMGGTGAQECGSRPGDAVSSAEMRFQLACAKLARLRGRVQGNSYAEGEGEP